MTTASLDFVQRSTTRDVFSKRTCPPVTDQLTVPFYSYTGREPAAAPAAGSVSNHEKQSRELFDAAFCDL